MMQTIDGAGAAMAAFASGIALSDAQVAK